MPARTWLLPLALVVAFATPITLAPIASQAQTEPAPPQATAGIDPLTGYEIRYRARMVGLSLDARRTLTIDDNGLYHLKQRATHFLGSVEEEAWFKPVDPDHIQVFDYRYEQRIVGFGKTQTVDFDWDNNVARYRDGKKDGDFPLDQYKMDRISHQLQLRRDLAQGQREDLNYLSVERGKEKTYPYVVLGDEVLDTPAGKLATLKVELLHDDPERKTYIWFAKDWAYALIKLQQIEDDGSEYFLEFERGSIGGQEITGQ